ncbi:hypothetical protein B0O99DRAFT_631153 [Bisporella sp. PMI_857]|nr:hypothetical protein B0O99DRAFT_631153 [Bisporella sp. PMI_857]
MTLVNRSCWACLLVSNAIPHCLLRLPNCIAHIPVPVPMSRTQWASASYEISPKWTHVGDLCSSSNVPTSRSMQNVTSLTDVFALQK